MGINEEHTSKQEKRRRFSCCKLKRTGAGLPCFSTVPSSYDVDVFAGGFASPALASWFLNEVLAELVRRPVEIKRLCGMSTLGNEP